MKILKILVCCVIISCQSNDKMIDFRDKAIIIKPVRSIEKLSDSIYFSDQVGQITSNQNMILIPEPNSGKYYFIDSNLNFLFEFGSLGKGPGEFLYNNRGFIRDSIVYLPDYANGKIETYVMKDNTLILVNEADNNYHIGEWGGTINNKHRILTSCYLTSKPFLEYNPENGMVTDSFGAFMEYDSFEQKRANNSYLMDYYNKNRFIFTVNIQIPYVRIYADNNNYELLNEYEFDKEFKRYYDYLDDEYNGRIGGNGIMTNFVEDMALNNEFLYLLVWNDILDIRNPNVLIEIDYQNNFKITRVFKLSNNSEHSSFSSICFMNNKLIGFEKYTSSLMVYDIY